MFSINDRMHNLAQKIMDAILLYRLHGRKILNFQSNLDNFLRMGHVTSASS